MEKLNIAELLKDCPRGMELDCTLFEGLEFDCIVDNEYLPIRCRIKHPNGGYNVYNFTKYGCWLDKTFAKCVIFPKGKTTWDGFQRPFKDGDIIFEDGFHSICIFKKEGNIKGTVDYYCGISLKDFFVKDKKDIYGHFGYISEYRLATEEEKQKLFDAIKANGYKWNAETKTLEKLIVPKFKVGDRVRLKSKPNYRYTIYSLIWDDNKKLAYNLLPDNDKHLRLLTLNAQDDYELVPNKFDITTLKPFESRVLVRTSNYKKWVAAFYSHYDKDSLLHHCVVGGLWYEQCIPYKGNEHLLDTTNDCDDYFKTW